ncbi:MAG: small acid-soluble spore protein Tlp [Actinomycetes bacterium]
MSNSKHPKPDDRSNNVERIRDIVRNTEDNLREAEISMEFADSTQREMMQEKNARRKQSIEALKEEMKDEIAARKKGES